MSTPLTTEIVQQILSVLTAGGQQYAYADPFSAAAQPFTPTTPNNWPLPLPTTIQEALDDLAARPNITTTTNAAILSSAGALTALATNVLSVNRGIYLLLAQISGGLSANGTMSLQLRMNGASQTSVTDTVGAVPDSGFSLVAHTISTFTRNTNVTFDINITPTGGGSWNIPVGLARLTILEF